MGLCRLEVEALRDTVKTLLKRCIFDNDDEVRDRATFFLRAIDSESDSGMNALRSIVVGGLPFPVSNLEESLKLYIDAGETDLPFDPTTVSRVQKPADKAADRTMLPGLGEDDELAMAESTTKSALATNWGMELAKV